MKIKQLLLSALLVLGVSSVVLTPVSNVSAIEVFEQCGANKDSAVCAAKDEDEVGDMVKTIVNTLLMVLGMIAVVMIVIGGIRYTTSNGDSSAITGAKNTILYSVIGLIVAIMSYAIVNFVIDQF